MLIPCSQLSKPESKDDRPADNISFAATNLVKTDIQSRRQQTDPPISRNGFPPTPPPEERGPSRGMSVRNGGGRVPPARLNLDTQMASRKYEKAISPQDSATSANSARPTRSASSATSGRAYPSREDIQPAPLQRRPTRPIPEDDRYEDNYGAQNQRYGRTSRSSADSRGSRQASASRRRQPRQQYIDEEEPMASDYEDGSFDDENFDMMPRPGRRAGTGSVSSSRGASRRPAEVNKFRIKVHHEEVRYVVVGPAIEFQDFSDKIRDKFALRRKFKIKIKDEDMPDGDMITMGDQDDLDMALHSARDAAKRQQSDVGKVEVWIFDV